MYWIVKFIQAAGLAIILVGFIQRFPGLMSPKIFFLGLGLFLLGTLVGRLFKL